MLREHRGFFFGITLSGLALRLLFLVCVPAVTDDSHVYIDLASNWMHHGIYGQTEGGQIVPADTRLPGYPAFLATIFWIFGVQNLRAVFLIQILLDLLTCLIVADLARRAISPRAGRVAFLLAALCPFLANYSAAILTETLEVFFTALALDCAATALERPAAGLETGSARWILWTATGASVAACILLRPDGGIVLATIGICLLYVLWKSRGAQVGHVLLAGSLIALIALAPLVPWTIRNWRVFHQFQPLAPRYATESEEVTPRGFNRWVSTWMADYASVEEIYWNVPGDKIDTSKLPRRALDSAKDETMAVIADYNAAPQLTAQLDGRFDAVARRCIRVHPFRYYILLPSLRVADMWLRPKTELVPSDPRWWEFNDDLRGSTLAVGLGAINLFYVTAALFGLLWRRREIRYLGMLFCFVVLRTALLWTIENPEPRYTLECYPVVIVLAAALLALRRPAHG